MEKDERPGWKSCLESVFNWKFQGIINTWAEQTSFLSIVGKNDNCPLNSFSDPFLCFPLFQENEQNYKVF